MCFDHPRMNFFNFPPFKPDHARWSKFIFKPVTTFYKNNIKIKTLLLNFFKNLSKNWLDGKAWTRKIERQVNFFSWIVLCACKFSLFHLISKQMINDEKNEGSALIIQAKNLHNLSVKFSLRCTQNIWEIFSRML